ncbi:hypothetical protein FQR65_LT05047 [Abscondita terminalis]|nr:hypothetical protein FQR65_LT05047 [Abscondita terminalis]
MFFSKCIFMYQFFETQDYNMGKVLCRSLYYLQLRSLVLPNMHYSVVILNINARSKVFYHI